MVFCISFLISFTCSSTIGHSWWHIGVGLGTYYFLAANAREHQLLSLLFMLSIDSENSFHSTVRLLTT